MDLSDHSSDDEDYDPTRDEEKDLEGEEGAPVRPLETALVKISRRRANAAEDLFMNMVRVRIRSIRRENCIARHSFTRFTLLYTTAPAFLTWLRSLV